jgi:hypothetical protein
MIPSSQPEALLVTLSKEIVPILARVGITPESTDAYSISLPVLEDIADVAALLPDEIEIPETEVDEDDGTVVLRWLSGDMRSSFSLTFMGLGSVAGYLSSDRHDPAWRIPLSERSRIVRVLGQEGVSALIARRPKTAQMPGMDIT